MADHQELIANFVGVVGSTPEQAQFYLEANNWDINSAMSNYYEEPEAATTGGRGRSTASLSQAGEDYEDDDDLDNIIARSAPRASAAEGKRKADSSTSGRRQGGISTFRDLTKSEDEDEPSSDEDSQNYFAGGEKSGVMVQGPPGKRDPNALVEDILKKAAKGGQKREEEPQQPAPKKSYFTGSGNRLGSEGESPSSSTPSAPQVPVRSTPSPEILETVTRSLTFWRNGYSLEDGPLMSYTDPANSEFLDAINRGQAPLKFLNIKPGQPVEMRVAKRMDEDYQEPPKAPPKAFEGTGNRLGSVASSGSGSSTPGAFPGNQSSSSASSASQASVPVPRSLDIDESQPVTSIQIRLADGTRMVARFNHTHTINDIRGFINASRAGEGSRPYVLQTTFPKKDLEDVTQTVKDAGLLNAVVLQRLV